MLSLKPSLEINRSVLAQILDSVGIGNRMFFGGNLTKQPAFVSLKNQQPHSFRTISPLDGADLVMESGMFIGVYPGLTEEMMSFMAKTIKDAIHNNFH